MSTLQPPADAPPSYETATGSSSSTTPAQRVSTDGPSSRTTRNGIPPERRRSMEDEHRELPPGWVRQFDSVEQHQFFVDTTKNPPRSSKYFQVPALLLCTNCCVVWVHPYDDPEFLATLSPEERKKHSRLHRSVTLDDIAAEDTDDEDHAHHPKTGQLPPRDNQAGQPTGIHKFGRKMKDKLTSSTHEQREAQRRKREEQERRAYQAHLQARQAMVRALQTGQPQFLCKDGQGRDVYIEPPNGPAIPRGAYGWNPYAQGPYANPNVRFVRPAGPYGKCSNSPSKERRILNIAGRPVGYGYGGGYGAPIAAGFLGGALMGGLLF